MYLLPQNVHRLLPELPVSQCKYLSQACVTCTPLAPFDNLKFVYVIIIDAYSSFVYAPALSKEKTVNAIKDLKWAMVVMGIPWALKTNNGPAYTSQQFNDFLGSWKISHATGIPCGQVIVERINKTLKELLARSISPEVKRDPHLA